LDVKEIVDIIDASRTVIRK